MKSATVLLLLCHLCVNDGTEEQRRFKRTLYGNTDLSHELKKTVIVNRNDELPQIHNMENIETVSSTNDSIIVPKINHLNDTHRQLMVHWAGEGSNVIICLARDPTPATIPGSVGADVRPSAVYISYDYGNTYENKTDLFMVSQESHQTYATLDKFYNHPKYNTHFAFVDVKNNLLFVTTNQGRDIKKIELDFTPSEVSFHELEPSVFVVLDKQDSLRRLWVTNDFGNTFRQAQNFIKSFDWVKDSSHRHALVVQRVEPSGYNAILYSDDLFSNQTDQSVETTLATDTKDVYVKDDYLFATVLSSEGVLELYVFSELRKKVKCVFDTQLEIKGYFIVDVTGNKALVAISHSETASHLYITESLDGLDMVRFTLSLEDVFCYFPNSTWHRTREHQVSEDAFVDVYKVRGLLGIYIASRVLTKPQDNNLGPQHLGSVITFDHGRTWRLIVAPDQDVAGQSNSCSINHNCSLHLSKKWNQLYPDTGSVGILSSNSAPGIIIATGSLGKSFKGYLGVYISTDAGLTWRQTLRDLNLFNIGDHGGILTAIKYFKLRRTTRNILYSTDEGEKWQQAELHSENIRVYGLMTEQGENTTIFTIFGSLPQKNQWIIVKVDLINAFERNCSNDDYITWSPSQTSNNRSYSPCVLGQQLTYQRRKPHANCYIDENIGTPISMMPCGCDFHDYECDFGFARFEIHGHCVRNTSITDDPYRIPLTCKPGEVYQRTKGYRKIQGDVCKDGFENQYMPEEVPCPYSEVQDFLLFAQRDKIYKYNLVTGTLEELPVKKLKNVIAIDFDMKNNCVYWADVVFGIIRRQCLNTSGSSESEILVSNDLESIEGMALDWLSNTLYFVDGRRSKIELIRTDIQHGGRMRRTILGPTDLKKPRGIAVHPKAGYMFWTDWSNENPSVNRADLDGKNIKKLFGKPRVAWPNGISIDYIAERIYWVDARQDYIASSDLHGDFFKMIISHKGVVAHPFGVAVFKNNMYWDDWRRNAIFSADKDGFSDGKKVLGRNLPPLMDLKVYANGIRIGLNACTNTSCSHICVGKPGKHQRSCLCPDGMDLQSGKCLPSVTYPDTQNRCNNDQFMCNNNNVCIPKGWKCDGEDDCGDSSDETHCGIQTCPPNYFVCNDGKCLPQYWRCDYDNDCSDGSDEKDCPRNCTENQFACNNGRCIAAKWKCDGENDCRDGSDELNCDRTEAPSCKTNEFECKAGGVRCIPLTWQCDGVNDCGNGSDEVNCKNRSCSDTVQFACGGLPNKCIYSSWVCDGDKDCPDGRDEMNCTTSTPELGDVLDITIPKDGTCKDWMFKCANQKCIPYWWKCDDSNDCGDGSDEVGCPNMEGTTTKPITFTPLPSGTCGSNQYQCASGGCIFSSWVCDGMEDCIGGEDERQCSNVINCTTNQFRCRRDGSCIPKKLVCNQQKDRPDGTDEQECDKHLPNSPATPSCSKGYFPCDEDRCYPLAALCDGKADCVDGYDELNCTKRSRVYQVLQIGVDERGINESTLLLYWWIATPSKDRLEFMPSISKTGVNSWHNMSWMEATEYMFKELEPATRYNMTIYVRVQNTTTVFLPVKYFTAYTGEGVPTESWNVTAVQQNGSHVLLSWNPPVHPNGQIVNYDIYWYPPVPPMKTKLSGNKTAHFLPVVIEPNQTYSFYVIAHNRKYESKKSEVITLNIDGEVTTPKFDSNSTVNDIEQLTVQTKTENSVTLSWKYEKKIDGFKVGITPDSEYPRIPGRSTKEKTITIDNLAPGAKYTFFVNAFEKSFMGPKTNVTLATDGITLPMVPLVEWKLISTTSVKLKWGVPKYSMETAWTYGVYYGIEEEELYDKPRINTTQTTVTILNLQAPENYRFRVGIVEPYGLGPLSKSVTHSNILESAN